MQTSALAQCMAAVLAASCLPVHAASPSWAAEFTYDIVAQESLLGVESPFERWDVSSYGGAGVSSGGNSADVPEFWSDGNTMLSTGLTVASVSNTTLKARARIEGVLMPTVVNGPTCFPNPSVPGGVTCSNMPLEEANWLTYSYYGTAKVRLNDSVIATHSSAPVGGFRLVFQIDGEEGRDLGTFQPTGTLGGTGGGYALEYVLNQPSSASRPGKPSTTAPTCSKAATCR